MTLLDRHQGAARKRIEDGTYPARIVQLLRIGRQKGEYQGEPYNKDTIWVGFEFPTEVHDFGGEMKPLWMSGEMTFSTNEKAKFAKLINATNPDVEEVKDLLGAACLVEVGSTSGGNAKFVGAMKLPKGMTVDPLANDPVYYNIANPDVDVFNEFPQFLKDKILESDDYVKPSATGKVHMPEGDTPF